MILSGPNDRPDCQDAAGTTKANFQMVRFAQIDRSNRTVVRTAVQHMSTVHDNRHMSATATSLKACNGYRLDSRTTTQCRSLSGKRVSWTKAHDRLFTRNCRSTTVPVLDDASDILDKGATQASKGEEGGQQVSADLTYYEWLKRSQRDFRMYYRAGSQANCCANGGLSADRFPSYNSARIFSPDA